MKSRAATALVITLAGAVLAGVLYWDQLFGSRAGMPAIPAPAAPAAASPATTPGQAITDEVISIIDSFGPVVKGLERFQRAWESTAPTVAPGGVSAVAGQRKN